jgi:copper(I)-binding protein
MRLISPRRYPTRPGTNGHRAWRAWRRPAGTAAALVAGLPLAALVLLAGTAGCAAQASTSREIQLGTVYVPAAPAAGTTVAYVVIKNDGPADELVAARTSAGGQVLFAAAPGRTPSMVRTVPVPAHSTLAMTPGTVHLVITGAKALQGGKDVTLTLVFARAGTVSVVAVVTNPATGGSSYFEN